MLTTYWCMNRCIGVIFWLSQVLVFIALLFLIRVADYAGVFALAVLQAEERIRRCAEAEVALPAREPTAEAERACGGGVHATTSVSPAGLANRICVSIE